MRRLGRDEARRIAVRAQLLDAYRPASLLEVVDHLTQLQIDPTNAIVPSADLVAWARLGEAYAPTDLTFALESERTLVEYTSFIRPMADIGVFLALAVEWPRIPEAQRWVAAKRRWGYFALPILHGDRLVGKLDAKADRKAGVLNVYAVHEDVPFTAEVADAVEAEIDALADWLGLAVAHVSH